MEADDLDADETLRLSYDLFDENDELEDVDFNEELTDDQIEQIARQTGSDPDAIEEDLNFDSQELDAYYASDIRYVESKNKADTPRPDEQIHRYIATRLYLGNDIENIDITLYVRKQSHASQLNYGDVITVRSPSDADSSVERVNRITIDTLDSDARLSAEASA
jgi:hypothetical protein